MLIVRRRGEEHGPITEGCEFRVELADVRVVEGRTNTCNRLGYDCDTPHLTTILHDVAHALGPDRAHQELVAWWREFDPTAAATGWFGRIKADETEEGERCMVCGERGWDRRTLLADFCVGDWYRTHASLTDLPLLVHLNQGEDPVPHNFAAIRACKDCRGDFCRLLRAWCDGKAFRVSTFSQRDPVEPFVAVEE